MTHRRPWSTALAAAALFAGVPSLGAQQKRVPATITVRADNDAFNFWIEPGARPDRDYTSGVALTWKGGDAPWWGRALARSDRPCGPFVDRCRSHVVEVGQKIFTPERTRDRLTPSEGSRPNAGWLYVREGIRRHRPGRQDEASVTLGVTGKPALAHVTQSIAHGVAPSFNRPIDWSEQLPFTVGVIAGYSQARRAELGALGAVAFDVVPRVSVAVGNVATWGEGELRLRAGWHLPHPWLVEESTGTAVIVSAAVASRAVARDVFLDGYVEREPVLYSGRFHATLRHRAFVIKYGSVTDSRAYRGAPARHTWSTMSVGLTLHR